MSSLSSSAIHLGGELVIGCDTRHNKGLSRHLIKDIYMRNIYYSMSGLFNCPVCKLKQVTVNLTHIFTRCSKFCNSGHCDYRIINITTLQNKKHDIHRNYIFKSRKNVNLHCSGHRSGDARSNFSKLSKDVSKSSPINTQKVFVFFVCFYIFFGKCINCQWVINTIVLATGTAPALCVNF